MSKLTPAKRLKELRKSGWLDFVEVMESKGIQPKDLRGHKGLDGIKDFVRANACLFMALDMNEDLYSWNKDLYSLNKEPLAMKGLSEQISDSLNKSKPKNNKITKHFNRNVK